MGRLQKGGDLVGRIDIRLTEEEKAKLQQQAKQLGLNASEYIRLIISLDTATSIISSLKKAKEILDGYGMNEE